MTPWRTPVWVLTDTLRFQPVLQIKELTGSHRLEVRMRTPAPRFEELVVWQKAHQFVLAVYLLEAYSQAILTSDF